MGSDSLVPSRALRSRVRSFILEHGLIAPGDRVLVGLSGGPDSTCLLLILAALRRSLGFELEAAHFDHQLRGRRAAAKEMRFASSLAERLSIPLHAGGGDVRRRARERKQSLEEAARELRYSFLATTASELDCASVAVGHTTSDQAETVLLHLVRGTGLRGLAGMTPSSAWPVPAEHAPALIRPLLSLSREQTAQCCDALGLAPVDDPSNRSSTRTRSRIRHELIPLLRSFNPRIEGALARLASSASGDVALLEQLASNALQRSRSAGEVRIERKRLSALPPSLQRHAVRMAIAQLAGDTRNLAERHVRSVIDAGSGPAGTHLDLPRGIQISITRTAVILATQPSKPARLPARPASLPVPGLIHFGPWQLKTELLTRRPRKLSTPDGLLAVLDADHCQDLHVRRWRQGDRFQPLGMQHAKKLQDFFVDAHVPRDERAALPLVVTKRGIAWVATQRPAEWAKVTNETTRFLRIGARA